MNKHQDTLRLWIHPILFLLLVIILSSLVVPVVFWGMAILNRVTKSTDRRVYEEGKRIGNTCYRVYEGHVYTSFMQEAEFRIYTARKLDVDPEKFVVYPNVYCAGHDDKVVYIAHVELPEADIQTFREIQKNMDNHIFADKNNIYIAKYYPAEIRDRSFITIIKENTTSLRVLGDFSYLIGTTGVYYQGQKLNDLDPNTVRFIRLPSAISNSYGDFMFDYKNKVLYCGGKQITALDLNELAKYSYTEVMPGGQMRTWYLLGDGYTFYTSECDRLRRYVKQIDRSRIVKLGKVY